MGFLTCFSDFIIIFLHCTFIYFHLSGNQVSICNLWMFPYIFLFTDAIRDCFLSPTPLDCLNFGLHLLNQHLQLLLTFLSCMSIHITGVLFAVGLHGRILSFKEVVIDLAGMAGARLALVAHVGHSRLSRLDQGHSFPNS